MLSVKETIRELAQHAIAKNGAQQSSCLSSFDVLEYPSVEVYGALWGVFLEALTGEFFGEGEPYARIPVLADRLKEHQQRYPVIRESDWDERDGHIYLEVPLKAGVPIDFIKSLIDDAYLIVWNKLDGHARLLIELAGQPYDEPKLLDQLIEIYALNEHREEIGTIVRPAILLRTRKTSEAEIPLGATKIGGQPDLPKEVEWPLYRGGSPWAILAHELLRKVWRPSNGDRDDKPLAFLAQIDLAQIAKLGTPIHGLPSEGLLSLFSAWGWMEEGDGDPHTPTDGYREQRGWTVVLHTPKGARLERRRTPRGVNSYNAAAVEPTPILSLPNHRVEPPVRVLGWPREVYDRFDRIQSDFRSLQMGHWRQNRDVFASHHLLGGYALFQQQFPEELLEAGLAMLLQIGTDGNSGMGWGDGGELTFYADERAMAQGRFERIWGTCQGG